MSSARQLSAAAYAREIEARWSRLLDRPVVLSPKDWVLISDWHARGIPLQIIDESILAAGERKRRSTAPRGLAYIAPSVEEAWRVVLEGRLTPTHSTATPGQLARSPIDLWRGRMREEPSGSRLRGLLKALLAAHEAGEIAETLEERFERALPDCVDGAWRRNIEERVDRELAPFLERMDQATLEETRRSAVLSRMRDELGLPSLRGSTRE
jgi:hypothetical protein